MKNIILIAAPAAGKGTEAAKIKEQYNMPHISTGDLLRAARDTNPVIAEYQDKGMLVPFDIVLGLLKDRITQPDCDNGYILDGFPRDLKQSEAYDKILEETGKDAGVVIVLDVDKDIAASRIAGRWSCPNCGKVYNVDNPEMKPKTEGKCDDCNSDLTHRDDDNKEVYEERYNSYLKNTEPLIEYYNKKGVVYHVDSSISPDKTHEQVVEIIGE